MSKTLVIIESPGKIKKISSILGDDYIVKASFGHIRDLDKATLSIDIEDNFKPNYLISEDKRKLVKELKELSKSCNVVIATDNDREGEGIALGLKEALQLKKYSRIVFTEITSKAILNALKNPSQISMNMANAQEARRILDRLMGYILSPILWRYLSKEAKSAGRVQSVVNRIIIDKENEIKQATSSPYLKTVLQLNYKTKKISFVLEDNNITIPSDFLSQISAKTKFKIVDKNNRISIRIGPSALFF